MIRFKIKAIITYLIHNESCSISPLEAYNDKLALAQATLWLFLEFKTTGYVMLPLRKKTFNFKCHSASSKYSSCQSRVVSKSGLTLLMQ